MKIILQLVSNLYFQSNDCQIKKNYHFVHILLSQEKVSLAVFYCSHVNTTTKSKNLTSCKKTIQKVLDAFASYIAAFHFLFYSSKKSWFEIKNHVTPTTRRVYFRFLLRYTLRRVYIFVYFSFGNSNIYWKTENLLSDSGEVDSDCDRKK